MSVDRTPLTSLAVTPVHFVSPGDTGRRAEALMSRFNVDQLPVIEPGDRLCGVVTWQRLSLERRDWGEVEVSDLVSKHPAERVCRGDTPLGEVFDLLVDHDFVLISDDEGHTVTAIVTINDVARYLYNNAD
ncbi:MAG: CBS domain-containing protein [bacterium]|nr:CBS domain-containing protein [bacterium]